MSVLNQIAYFQGRRDEVPNQELARDLARRGDTEGIREIAENLWNKNRNIQSDCIKVLYEIGYLNPELIAAYLDDFLRLLSSKNNRMVWGSMTALSTITSLRADKLFLHIDEIKFAMEKGSVITVDSGVKVLAAIAAADDHYQTAIFPYLLEHLETCRPKDVPQHAESILPALNDSDKAAFLQVLEVRMEDMNSSQAQRLRKMQVGVEDEE